VHGTYGAVTLVSPTGFHFSRYLILVISSTETFQWSQPVLVGDIPPPCRAHTATLVDKRIFIFGGGEGPTYYNR
jgi:hypothetical protein